MDIQDKSKEQLIEELAEMRRRVESLEASEAEFERAEKSLRLPQFAIDRAGDATFWMGSDARFTYVNEAACRSLGYSREELLSMTVHDVDPDFPKKVWLAHWDEVRQRRAFTFESRHRTKGGRVFPVEVTVNYFEFDGKEYNCAFARDISRRKQAERRREELVAELEAKNAELERFAYTVSHDLKSPLITIKGFLDLLQRDVAEGDVARLNDDVARVTDATDKMQQLLDEVLNLSRIGRMVNPPEDVPLGELVQKVAALLAGQIAERGIRLEVAADLPVLRGDRPRLREVLQNLVENAAKYMGDQSEPRIEIDAREKDGQVVCCVRDNGIGIEPQYHARVFDLFNKLDPRAKGTGVGLALAKRIVEVHGGRIWVESEGLGHGATFCFTLSPTPEKGEEHGSTE